MINALRMRPSRLMVGEVRGEETRELFSSANLGIPFITTMHSNAGGMDIVKKLMVRPMGVESRSLSMLDVALYMRHADISRRVLSDVSSTGGSAGPRPTRRIRKWVTGTRWR